MGMRFSLHYGPNLSDVRSAKDFVENRAWTPVATETRRYEADQGWDQLFTEELAHRDNARARKRAGATHRDIRSPMVEDDQASLNLPSEAPASELSKRD